MLLELYYYIYVLAIKCDISKYEKMETFTILVYMHLL